MKEDKKPTIEELDKARVEMREALRKARFE